MSVTEREPVASPPAPPKRKSERLPEIDIFRAFAISMMGITHAEMRFPRDIAPNWAFLLRFSGFFFCYIAFLTSFSMSLAISAERGGLDKPGSRGHLLKRALVLLIAYHLVSFGKYAPELLHGTGQERLMHLVNVLTLREVTETGAYFLSFALFLLFVAFCRPALKWSLQNPIMAMAAAFGLHLIGYRLTEWAIPDAIHSYWKLFIGSMELHHRDFAVVLYAPIFVFGLLLGRSYLLSTDRTVWRGRALVIATLVFAITAAISHTLFPSVRGSITFYEPVPSLLHLVGSSCVTVIVFALYGAYAATKRDLFASPVARFLIYVGQNSIWVIVCQYIWMAVALKRLGGQGDSSLRMACLLFSMIVMPPVLLTLAQRAGQAVFPKRNA